MRSCYSDARASAVRRTVLEESAVLSEPAQPHLLTSSTHSGTRVAVPAVATAQTGGVDARLVARSSGGCTRQSAASTVLTDSATQAQVCTNTHRGACARPSARSACGATWCSCFLLAGKELFVVVDGGGGSGGTGGEFHSAGWQPDLDVAKMQLRAELGARPGLSSALHTLPT